MEDGTIFAMADTSKRATGGDAWTRALRKFRIFASTPRFAALLLAAPLGYALAGLYRSGRGAKHG